MAGDSGAPAPGPPKGEAPAPEADPGRISLRPAGHEGVRARLSLPPHSCGASLVWAATRSASIKLM